MAEIATLGLRVDATGAIQAVNQFTTEVNKAGLGAAALDVEVKRVSGDLALARQHFQQGKISVSDYATAVSQAKREMGQLNAVQSAATPVNQRIAQSSAAVGSAFNASSAGANRLASGLGPLVAQATGTNPALARLASTLGMLGLGAPIMVGVLGGIAAAVAGYKLWTEETRGLAAEQDKLIQKLAEAYRARQAATTEGMEKTGAGLAADLRSKLPGVFLGVSVGNADTKEVDDALDALREHNRLMAEKMVLDQRIEGISTRTTAQIETENKAREEATRALADYNNQLVMLDVTLTAAKAGYSSDLVAELMMGPRTLRSARGGVAWQDPSTLGRITRPSTGDPSKGGTNWVQVAQIGGGIILGSGLAGDGYKAAGLSGAMSGAAQGAMIGTAIGPLGAATGAVIGGVAGLVAGLFGQAKKAKEAAEKMAEAQKAFDQDLKTRMLMAQGMTDEAETVRRLATNEKELAEARKAGMSASSLAVLQQVQAEEALAVAAAKAKQATDDLAISIQKMRDTMNDLTERAYTAAGQGSVGARIGLVYRQGKEMAGASPELREATGIVQQMELARFDAQVQVDAINKRADEQIKALDAQRSISEDGLRVAQDQLSAQEKTIDAMQRVVDSLDEYSNSLKIGPLSVLSPYKQLQESRSQFDMLTALAKGGDLTAAASLPGAGNALLQSSRAFNASGPGYVADYNRVQSQITNIRDQFSGQISTAQQSLSELKAQTVLLQGVIAAIGAEKLRIDVQRNAEIDNVWKGFTERVDKWLTAFQTAMALLQTNMPKMTDAEFSAAFPTNKSGTNTEPAVGPNPNPEDSDAITAARYIVSEQERMHQESMMAQRELGEKNRLAAEAASITPQYNEGL